MFNYTGSGAPISGTLERVSKFRDPLENARHKIAWGEPLGGAVGSGFCCPDPQWAIGGQLENLGGDALRLAPIGVSCILCMQKSDMSL